MTGLAIGHGDPWWLSPNVWVVPASKSSEPSPGEVAPVVGQQYYGAANVENTTNAAIQDATVYFWWANPSLGIITTVNANLIGTSSVTVNGGQSANTLELAPWVPVFQNGGHECIIAAVVQSGGMPPTVLDGANDPTVAQRNLGVVMTTRHLAGRFHYPIQVCNAARRERVFAIAARQAPLTEIEPFLRSLPGAPEPTEQLSKVAGLGFLPAPCPDPSDYHAAKPALSEVKLPPLSCTGFSVVGVLETGTALVHVTQMLDDRIVGGVSVVIFSDAEASA